MQIAECLIIKFAVQELQNAYVAVTVNTKLYKNIPYAANTFGLRWYLCSITHLLSSTLTYVKNFAIVIRKNEAFLVICRSFYSNLIALWQLAQTSLYRACAVSYSAKGLLSTFSLSSVLFVFSAF